MSNEPAHLARLEALIAEARAANRESERDLRQSQAERSEEARQGRLGRDWQAIQHRIDAGQTSLADVFTGRDDSPEARRLVELSRANLELATEEAEMPDHLNEEMSQAQAQFERLRILGTR